MYWEKGSLCYIDIERGTRLVLYIFPRRLNMAVDMRLTPLG